MSASTAYLDMYGRAIRTAVEGFGGVDRRVDVFYDARGRTACESEPHHAGETARYTRYTYDTRNRLTGATRPDGGVTGVEYAAASNRVTATVTETVMPSSGTMAAATRKTKRAHNVLGELVSTTEGAEQTDADEGAEQTDTDEPVETRYAYDGAGRLETVTTGGQTTTFKYDAAGNRESVTNPNLGATVSAGTDVATDMVSVRFEYDGHGELTERTDARGATYYAYDDLGRRTCAADRGGTATWEYDTANGTGLLERRSYDRDTVLTSASSCALGGDFAETYTYNTDARLKTVTTSIVDDQDPATPTTLTRSYGYDDYGRPASTTYPSSVTVTHKYNEHGYAAKLLHGETELVKVTAQTAYGQSGAESYGNGVRTRRSYDELGRLTDIDTIRRGAKIQDNTYAWRSDGSLQRRAVRAGSRVKREFFAYDYLNRLTEVATHFSGSSTASRTLAFDYDPRGNLKFKTSDVSGDDRVTDYDYPTTSNRLTSATVGDVAHEFMHDTSGHITQYACTDDDEDDVDDCADADDTFIEWNARGLAEKVTVGESKTDATPTARDSFRYGPDGARYFKKTEWAVESGATTTTRKYYAGAYEKTVTVGGDTVERTRIGASAVHVKTTPASMMATPSSVFEYVHRDHLGSVEAVTDASGNELVVLGYDPYGERRDNDWTARLTETEIETLLSDHGERVSRGFTGHEHLDRTGLIHMNGRVYDPRLGGFLSPDPIVGDPTSSQSWNLYSYVGNNPLSYVDPTGLVQAGPGCGPLKGCLHFGGGGAGGGSTTRTVTVTTTETVHGVMAIPYRHAVPVWTRVGGSAWPGGNDFWGVDYQPYSFSHNVTRTVAVEDQSVAEEPADVGGLVIAAADVGASILIPGYDLVRCNLDGDCGWSDWAVGIGEIAVSATGVGYGVREVRPGKRKAEGQRCFSPLGPSAPPPQSPGGPRDLAQDIRIAGKGHRRPRGMVARQQPLARLVLVGALDDQAVTGQEYEYPPPPPPPPPAVDQDRAAVRQRRFHRLAPHPDHDALRRVERVAIQPRALECEIPPDRGLVEIGRAAARRYVRLADLDVARAGQVDNVVQDLEMRQSLVAEIRLRVFPGLLRAGGQLGLSLGQLIEQPRHFAQLRAGVEFAPRLDRIGQRRPGRQPQRIGQRGRGERSRRGIRHGEVRIDILNVMTGDLDRHPQNLQDLGDSVIGRHSSTSDVPDQIFSFAGEQGSLSGRNPGFS